MSNEAIPAAAEVAVTATGTNDNTTGEMEVGQSSISGLPSVVLSFVLVAVTTLPSVVLSFLPVR